MRLERQEIMILFQALWEIMDGFHAREKDVIYFHKITLTVTWKLYWKGTKKEAVRPIGIAR